MAKKIKSYLNFKTLNTEHPTLIASDEFSDTLNMIRNSSGLWENRKGIAQFGADVGSGNPIHSLRFWETSSGARYLTVGTGGAIYSYAEGAEYNDGTYTSRVTGLTGSLKWDSIVYRDTIVLGNGTDNLRSSTDNTTFTSRSGVNIVAAKYLEVGNDFVSFSGVSSNKDQVLLSSGAPSNPWEYNASNYANIDIGNSSEIKGMVSLGDNLVVAKARQTYAVALSDFSRATLDFGGGCESNRAMVRTQINSIFLAGRQGIYSIAKTQIGNNQLFGTPESQPVKSLYDLITDYSSINSTYVFKDNWVLWSCDTSIGKITFLRDLDYTDSVWTYFYGVNANDWTVYQDGEGEYHYLFADSSVDKVWELFKGRNDNGAPILSRLTSKMDDFGQAGVKKLVNYIDIYGYISENATWTVQLFKDDNTTIPFKEATINSTNITQELNDGGLGTESIGTTPLGSLITSGDGDLDVYPFHIRINVNTYLEKFQFSLYNNAVDNRVILRGASVQFDDQPRDLINNSLIS